MTTLRELLEHRESLVLDGAMGTELFRRGLSSGNPPELWNIEEPDRVASVHEAYVDAGSDVVLTNSFGGTRYRLKLHDLHDQVFELNKAAALVARTACDRADRPVLVAGSMGPTGELLEPMGTMSLDACREAFAEQARGLAAGGADLFWVETMSDLDEAAAAVEGARSAADLPVVCTLSFDTAGRTMMGVTGIDAVDRLADLGVAAIGANCGNNLPDTEAALAQMRERRPDLLLVGKGNAGIPEWHGTELRYSGSPEVMGAYADRLRSAGVRLIGACCGSTPEHIAFIRKVLDGEVPVPEVEVQVATTNLVATGRTRSSRRRRR